MIKFTCSTCGNSLEVDDSAAGKQAHCPACKQSIHIPVIEQPIVTVSPPHQAPPPPAMDPQPAAAPNLPTYIRQGAAPAPAAAPASSPTAPAACPSCGSPAVAGMRFCTTCGTPLSASVTRTEATSTSNTGIRGQGVGSDWCYPSNPPRSPHIAWLNIVGGAGIAQLVHGQVQKGIGLMVASNILFIFSEWFAEKLGETVFAIAVLAFIAASAVDAFRMGKCLYRGQPVRQFAWFPKAT